MSWSTSQLPRASTRPGHVCADDLRSRDSFAFCTTPSALSTSRARSQSQLAETLSRRKPSLYQTLHKFRRAVWMPHVVFPHMAGVDATAVNSGHDGDNPEQMDTKQNATAASPNSTLDSPDAGATEPSVEQLPVPIPEGLTSLHIVGLGACGMDMLASVAEFPAPDDKIRTTEVSFLGGGNCANTLTAARRLGISCSLIAKVGDDANGSAVLSELARDGVDTTNMIVRKGMNTPFTYVIVSQACSSRTCIHTPASEDVRAEDLNDLNAVLSSASLLALDGRHTLAAVKLARKANELGIPVLLDVERNRPHLEELLPCADYIVTNSKYPMIFSPEASGPIDAMVRLLRAGRARFIITTAGSSGSTLLAREKDLPIGRPDPDLSISRRVEIPSGHDDIGLCAIVECPAWTPAKVVDTTGAGDAFIGGIAYGLCTGLGAEIMMGLASRVAAHKLAKLGARPGLPRREELDQSLFADLLET